jgi:hypothetical protein
MAVVHLAKVLRSAMRRTGEDRYRDFNMTSFPRKRESILICSFRRRKKKNGFRLYAGQTTGSSRSVST